MLIILQLCPLRWRSNEQRDINTQIEFEKNSKQGNNLMRARQTIIVFNAPENNNICTEAEY